MNTRSLWNFIGLSPGVVQAGEGSSTRRFAGSRANQSDASIDGITLSNQYDGTQISPLVSQIESFEEVRVDMANNTSEFGGIGQVTIVSKGGSNQLRGSLFRLLLHSVVSRARSVRGAARDRREAQSRRRDWWSDRDSAHLQRPESKFLLLLD